METHGLGTKRASTNQYILSLSLYIYIYMCVCVCADLFFIDLSMYGDRGMIIVAKES